LLHSFLFLSFLAFVFFFFFDHADISQGHGEHFITIGHAQAWVLVASDEARCLMFTKASMSTARSVRLAGMMGLNRLDSTHTNEELPMAPMISPPRDWAELEERRRLFWAGFCIDSYSSISAGWPTLIDVDQAGYALTGMHAGLVADR